MRISKTSNGVDSLAKAVIYYIHNIVLLEQKGGISIKSFLTLHLAATSRNRVITGRKEVRGMEITTDVNSRLPKATMIFDEDRRRCSKEAGDPQGGCNITI